MRLGQYGEPPNVTKVYEVYNTDTDMVEDRQAILPNACRAARLYATALAEAMRGEPNLEWDEEE